MNASPFDGPKALSFLGARRTNTDPQLLEERPWRCQ